MRVRIVRVDKTLPLPEYKTEGAVAFDFYARENTFIQPNTVQPVPTNLIIEVPKGHALIIAARSGLEKNKGLMLKAIGIIDQDFHGPADELIVRVHNFTDSPVAIERGERIAQGLIVPIEKAEWEEVEKIKEESRGGFGTTGNF